MCVRSATNPGRAVTGLSSITDMLPYYQHDSKQHHAYHHPEKEHDKKCHFSFRLKSRDHLLRQNGPGSESRIAIERIKSSAAFLLSVPQQSSKAIVSARVRHLSNFPRRCQPFCV
jgi:hypothetical protein